MSFIKEFTKSKNSSQTVFGFSDLSSAVEGYSGPKLKSALKYAVQKGDLYRISKGIYSLSTEYSKQEFANKYRSPSYISLYTVFQKAGIVFQPYSSIYIISNRSEEVDIDSQTYIYRKIKDEILLNPMGIKNENNIQVATAERAMCDKLYLDGDEYFDNVRNIDWEFMRKINNQVYRENIIISNFINKHIK
jgi:predicted transcriptional regulator of viral defense system